MDPRETPQKTRHRLLAPPEWRGKRLDLCLTEALPGASRKLIKRALDRGAVFVNEQVERRAGTLLQGGETLSLTLELPPEPRAAVDVPVLYRDTDLLAVNKPPGLPVHANVADAVNVHDRVCALLGAEGASDPILIHRLDADTTGVLLFALNREANRSLARQFSERQVEKTYLALVRGCPPRAFDVRDYLRPGVRGRTVQVRSGGQPAWTSFRTLACRNDAALVAARPHTGRTHQIRTHLASQGFPLFGDTLYGGQDKLITPQGPTLCPRHMLHAASLALTHPATGQPLVLTAPLPEDFIHLLTLSGLPGVDFDALWPEEIAHDSRPSE